MGKYFVAPPTLCRWAKDLVAKSGAREERRVRAGLAIKSRSHRHGAGGELKSTPFEASSQGSKQ